MAIPPSQNVLVNFIRGWDGDGMLSPLIVQYTAAFATFCPGSCMQVVKSWATLSRHIEIYSAPYFPLILLLIPFVLPATTHVNVH